MVDWWIVCKAAILSIIFVQILQIRTCDADKVFLVDGLTSNQGRLEVVIDGQRGMVCDNDWDINDAKVVCNMLGLPVATHAVKETFFGFVRRFPLPKSLMTNVHCIGNESSLFDCPFKNVSNIYCDTAGVVCGKLSVKFRLAGGRSPNEGTVLVAFGKMHGPMRKEWTIICDEKWTIKDARVVCRSLGYPDAMFAVSYAMFNDHDGMFFLLKDLHCQGNESRIAECDFNELKFHQSSCILKQVGVICGKRNSTVPLRLSGGPSASSGRVEINLGGHWSTICHNKWSINNAHVVCRSLGYPKSYMATKGSMFGPGNGRIVLDNVECFGNESSLLQCKHDGLGSKSCTSQEEAGVFCEKTEAKFKLGGNGHTPNQGLVLINIGGINGTLCYRGWENKDARVLCRSLGLGDEGYAVKNLAFGKGSGPILLSNMNCHGNETDLHTCDHDALGSHGGCSHDNDAGVICSAVQVRLVGGSAWNQGRAEIQIDGQWGRIGYTTDFSAPIIFCKMLGLPGQGYIIYEKMYKSNSKATLVSNVVCGLNYKGQQSLLECQFKYKVESVREDYQVNCGPPSEHVSIVNITGFSTVIKSSQSAYASDNDINTCLFVDADRRSFQITLNKNTYVHSVSLTIKSNLSYSSVSVIIQSPISSEYDVKCVPSTRFAAKIGMMYDCSRPIRSRHVMVNVVERSVMFGLCNINVFGYGDIEQSRGVLQERWVQDLIHRHKSSPLLRYNPYFNNLKRRQVYTTPNGFNIDTTFWYGYGQGNRISAYFTIPKILLKSGDHTQFQYAVSCVYECELWSRPLVEELTGTDKGPPLQYMIKAWFKTDKNDFKQYPEQISDNVDVVHSCIWFYIEGYLKIPPKPPSYMFVKIRPTGYDNFIDIPRDHLYWSLPGKRSFNVALTNTRNKTLEVNYGSKFSIKGSYSICCHGMYCPDCGTFYVWLVLNNERFHVGLSSMNCTTKNFTKDVNLMLQPGKYKIQIIFTFDQEGDYYISRDAGTVIVLVDTLLHCSFNQSLCPEWTLQGQPSTILWAKTEGAMYFNSSGLSRMTSPNVSPRNENIKLCLEFEYLMPVNAPTCQLLVSFHSRIYWLLKGYHGDSWNHASVSYEDGSKKFKVEFVGNSTKTNCKIYLRNVKMTTKVCAIKPVFAFPGHNCSKGELMCSNGVCYPYSLRCNGKVDGCSDGSDESGCACRSDDFKCSDGKCLPTSKLCDGNKDCKNGMDEKNCEKGCQGALCASGNCNSISSVCSRKVQSTSDPCFVPETECLLEEIGRLDYEVCNDLHGKCGFEESQCSLQSYNNSWVRTTAKASMVSSVLGNDHTKLSSEGHYMYFSQTKSNSNAETMTGRMKRTVGNATSCLQFWYVIHGSASLKIFTATNLSEKLSWKHGESTDRKWVFGQTVILGGQFDLIFEASTKTEKSFVALDDVSYSSSIKRCSTIHYKAPPHCSFGDGKCSWTGHEDWKMKQNQAMKRVMLVLTGGVSTHRSISSPVFNPVKDGWHCITFWLISTKRLYHREFQVLLTDSNGAVVKSMWIYKAIVQNVSYVQLPLSQINDNVKIQLTGLKQQDQPDLGVFNVMFLKEKCPTVKPIAECHDYQILNGIDRRVENTVDSGKCDSSINFATWYRIAGPAGNQIPLHCETGPNCGAQLPLTLEGRNPSYKYELVNNSNCLPSGRRCCQTRGLARVRHCGEFFVYNKISMKCDRDSKQICSTYREVEPAYDKKKEWIKWQTGNEETDWGLLNRSHFANEDIQESSDLYELHMSRDTIIQFSTSYDTRELTMCLWVSLLTNGSLSMLSHSISKNFGFGFVLTDGYVKINIGNESRTVSIKLDNNTWHHLCTTWISDWGVWRIYQDGFMSDSGLKFSDQSTLEVSGVVELLASSFSPSHPSNATVIKIASLNMWTTKLKDQDIVQMSYGCKMHMPHILRKNPFISWYTILALNGSSGHKARASCLGSGGATMVLRNNRTQQGTSGTLYSSWSNHSTDSNKECLRFRFKMSHVGKASLFIYHSLNLAQSKDVLIWSQSKTNSSNAWLFGQVAITTLSNFKITIKGELENVGYIAIGGVYVTRDMEGCATIPIEDNQFGPNAECLSLTSQEGQITTPHYPAPYERKFSQCWYIEAKIGQVILLDFKAFDLNYEKVCSKDYLDVFEMKEPGDDDKYVRLGRYCGAIYPTFLVSSRNVMKLVFDSAGGTYNGGFKIEYSVMKENRSKNCIKECPSACKCVRYKSDLIIQAKTLYSMPQYYPEGTTVIDFAGNNIYELKELDLLYLPSIKYLNLERNKILRILDETFDNNQELLYLILGNNFLKSVGKELFSKLPKLLLLDLQRNLISDLATPVFEDLKNLEILYMNGNLLESLSRHLFNNNKALKQLCLQENSINVIPTGLFTMQSQLKILNISSNRITRIDEDTFQGLRSLETLYLQNNEIKESDVSQTAFRHLSNLKYLEVDSFVICCYAKQYNPQVKCISPRNDLSSCEDLLKNPALSVFIWILGLLALLGNIWVIIFWNRMAQIDRGERGKKSRVQSFLLTNLAISDFLMGVYLIIIASHDVKWDGVYFKHDVKWRSSAMCNFAGALSMIASEVSVLTLTTITADRLNSIVFHIRAKPFTMVAARMVCVFIWIFTVLISLVPIIAVDNFEDKIRGITFYGRSSVCLPLQLSKTRPPGYEYAIAIYIALNGFAFVFILLSYIAIFIKVKMSSKAVRSNINKDSALARRVTLIVLTDFLCWMPVAIIGCLSLTTGFNDPDGEVYAWIAVFVLPINSSINPILYTFSNQQFRKFFTEKTCCNWQALKTPSKEKDTNELNRMDQSQTGATGQTSIKTPELSRYRRFNNETKEEKGSYETRL